jgi:hypothetical protein
MYLFAAFGLIGLVLAAPKLRARQDQLDRQYAGRNHSPAGKAIPGEAGVSQGRDSFEPQRTNNADSGYTSNERRTSPTGFDFRPLYLFLLFSCLIGWLFLFWQRFHKRDVSDVTKA